MRIAIIRMLILSLWRDRSALALAFLLPPVFFAVFAMIFAETASGELTVKAAIAVPSSVTGQQFAAAMEEVERLDIVLVTSRPGEVRRAVMEAEADAGLIVRPATNNALRYEIVVDPSRQIAARLVEGAVMEIAGTNSPQARLQEAIGFLQDEVITFSPDQQRAIGERLSTIDPAEIDLAGSPPPVAIMPLTGMAGSTASYYAIAVAMLFLFLSALQGALSLIEARESGIFDRLVVSRGGAGVVIDGTFGFLALQGLAQGAVIFLVAWAVFDVPADEHAGVIALIILAAAIATGGMALAIVSLCQSRRQAHSLGTIIVLLLGAIGGSMAPRILMPESVQKIGALTPNAWGIEAFSGVVIRGNDWTTILPFCTALVLAGVAGMLIARIAASRY